MDELWIVMWLASLISFVLGYVIGRWTHRTKVKDKYPTPTEKTREGHPERKWEPFEFEDRTLYRLR